MQRKCQGVRKRPVTGPITYANKKDASCTNGANKSKQRAIQSVPRAKADLTASKGITNHNGKDLKLSRTSTETASSTSIAIRTRTKDNRVEKAGSCTANSRMAGSPTPKSPVIRHTVRVTSSRSKINWEKFWDYWEGLEELPPLGPLFSWRTREDAQMLAEAGPSIDEAVLGSDR